MERKDMKDLFQKMDVSSETKDRIYQKIIEGEEGKIEIKEPVKRKRFFNSGFKIAAVFALVLLLSVTVYAVSSYQQRVTNEFIDLSISKDATKLVDVSAIDQGYKINAEAIFGDQYASYVLFSVEKENGSNLNLGIQHGEIEFGITRENSIFKGVDESSKSYYYLTPTENQLNKVYFVIRYGTDFKAENSLMGKQLEVNINEFRIGFWGKRVAGNWQLNIPLDYKDMGKTYEIHKEFEYDGKRAELEKIYYSPLDIRISIISKDGALKEMSYRDFEETHHIGFKNQKGEYLKFGRGEAEGDNAGTYFTKEMNRIGREEIKLEDVSTVKIGDIEIPVELK